MSETQGSDERGLTEDEYAALLPAMAAKRAEELNVRFADELPPGMGFAWVMEAMTQPAPGYRQIANEGGVRWHERIEPAAAERCTCTDAGGMVEVRGGRCTYCRKPYAG